jgi:cyclic-di-GMP phosphodiesterase TipF (flagellum assembly factor)
MSFLFHSLVALSYILLGAAAAFGLPLLATGIEPMLAFFVGGALGHQGLVQANRGRYIARELSVVSASSEALQRELESARDELREIKTRIGGGIDLSSPDAARDADGRSSNEVLGELRLLRTLFSQLTAKKGDKGEKSAAPSEPSLDTSPAPLAEPVLDTTRADEVPHSDDIEAPNRAKPTSGYRAEYMNLSSSLRSNAEAEPVKFPDMRSQRLAPAQPLGSNAQDILGITRDALERARVSLFLQPIVALPTRRVEFYEAYSRIQDQAGNYIGPHQYLELAERAGLVGAIDNNLLFRCIQLLRRVRRHNRDYGFFCNVSPHTLRDETFFGQFIEFLSDNVELADDLIFEFSQNDVETYYNEFVDNLDRLAALGFSFSIDRVDRLDLNFAELAKRNFNYVKVDAENLISLAGTERGQEQIRYLQQDLMDARVTMIVEKIETEPQLVELLDQNIRYGQGYLFGEPRESKT